MKRYITTFQALDRNDGKIKTFVGNDVYSSDRETAETMVKNNFPYLTIVGEFVSEVDEFTGKELDVRKN